MLYVGGGCLDASRELREFVDKTDIPVASTLMGLGTFPDNDDRALQVHAWPAKKDQVMLQAQHPNSARQQCSVVQACAMHARHTYQNCSLKDLCGFLSAS